MKINKISLALSIFFFGWSMIMGMISAVYSIKGSDWVIFDIMMAAGCLILSAYDATQIIDD